METLTILFLFCLTFGHFNCQRVIVKTRNPTDNQILFRERGSVINKATFLHIKFSVNMSETLMELDKVKNSLNKTLQLNLEQSKKGMSELAPFLIGLKTFDTNSIWSLKDIEKMYTSRSEDGVVINSMLLRMFEKNIDELLNTLMVLPSKSIKEKSHERSKRFDIFGSVIGSAALALGTRNAFKISEIERSLQNFTQKYNLVIDKVSLLDEKHERLAVDTFILKELIILLESQSYHKLITLIVTLNDQLNRVTSNVHSVIAASQQGKVSTELISGKDLIQLFEAVTIKAHELGCDMILEHPSDIYEVESTYGYDKEGQNFAIYVHIPLVEKEERLRLLEYVPFPILQSKELNATILPIVKQENLIALLPNENVRANEIPSHKYRILSDLELGACQRIRNSYICGGRNTLRTDIENSCVGSLWLREHTLIAKNCDMKISMLNEYVVKLGLRKWLVFSPSPLSTSIFCGKDSRENVRFEIQTEIEMIEDCKLSLSNHLLTTDVNVGIDHTIRVFDWVFSGNIFKDLSDNKDQLSAMIHQFMSSRDELRIRDLENLKHFYIPSQDQIGKIWEFLSSLNFIPWMDGILFVGCIILIFVAIYLISTSRIFAFCKQCCCSKSNVSFEDAPPPYNNVEQRSSLAREATPFPRSSSFSEVNSLRSTSVSDGVLRAASAPSYHTLMLEDAPPSFSNGNFYRESPVI